MSIPPNACSAADTAAAIWPASVTSRATARAWSPNSPARSATASARRAVTTTLWPASKAARAISRPKPVEQPVISQRAISGRPFRQAPQIRLSPVGELGRPLLGAHPRQVRHLGVQPVQLDHPSASAEVFAGTRLAELRHSQRQNGLAQA